ncbi:hypothetical protein D3C77_486170 [compost metagenome]
MAPAVFVYPLGAFRDSLCISCMLPQLGSNGDFLDDEWTFFAVNGVCYGLVRFKLIRGLIEV